MEQQFQSTQQEIVPNPVVVKQNKLLVIILSILLSLSALIAGFFAYQTQKLVKELTLLRTEPTPTTTSESVVSPELTFEQDKTLDPTANWKTYTNTQNFYSFRYPDTVYSIQESAQNAENARLLKGPVYHFEVEVTQITDSIENWFKKEKNNGQFPDEAFVSSQSTFQNYPALLIQSIPGALEYPTDIFIVKNKNRIYKIAFTKEGSDKTIVNQILSTFKFTN